MLLTLTTTRTEEHPATDLGYLLEKHPDRFQTFDVGSFGNAHAFYPEATEDRCTFSLLLEVDAIGLVKDKNSSIFDYVNDRPYVASSFLSSAMNQVLRSALRGKHRGPEGLEKVEFPLTARLEALPVRAGKEFLNTLFDPLGYELKVEGYPLDDQFPEWGDSPYYTVELSATTTVQQLLSHLYVLMPVFDNYRHEYIGDAEVAKLVNFGADWLKVHPAKNAIVRRFLRSHKSLTDSAFAQLVPEGLSEEVEEEAAEGFRRDPRESELEGKISLGKMRREAVQSMVTKLKPKSLIDLGCAQGSQVLTMISDSEFLEQNDQLDKILGIDASYEAVKVANARLRRKRKHLPPRPTIEFQQGTITYRSHKLEDLKPDAVTLIEVIEHLEPFRLAAAEQVVFRFLRPEHVILTTPNSEYNSVWESLPAGKMRHHDHKFEWTRDEFGNWCSKIEQEHGYTARQFGIGEADTARGFPTQAVVFTRTDDAN